MKIIIYLLLLSTTLCSQTVDTIIYRGIYQSHVSYKLKQPVYVKYKLYKGGGDCKRDKFVFKNELQIPLLEKEYNKSGFDRGHLANSEDFAYDCIKDELTFRYYNCLPQTPNLNRGTWKSWEGIIRQESQTDSLLIITGGIWNDSIVNGINVPKYCWKVVRSLKTKKITHVLLFKNQRKDAWCREIDLIELEKILGYKVF